MPIGAIKEAYKDLVQRTRLYFFNELFYVWKRHQVCLEKCSDAVTQWILEKSSEAFYRSEVTLNADWKQLWQTAQYN